MSCLYICLCSCIIACEPQLVAHRLICISAVRFFTEFTLMLLAGENTKKQQPKKLKWKIWNKCFCSIASIYINAVLSLSLSFFGWSQCWAYKYHEQGNSDYVLLLWEHQCTSTYTAVIGDNVCTMRIMFFYDALIIMVMMWCSNVYSDRHGSYSCFCLHHQAATATAVVAATAVITNEGTGEIAFRLGCIYSCGK